MILQCTNEKTGGKLTMELPGNSVNEVIVNQIASYEQAKQYAIEKGTAEEAKILVEIYEDTNPETS